MKRMQIVFLLLLLVSPTLAAEPAPEEDYRAVAGKWTRNDQTSNGSPLQVEQEISSKKSIVRVFDLNGKLVHEHQARFQLQRMEQVNVFIYFDLEVTAGPNKGKRQPQPRSFAYRIRNNQFIQIEGLLKEDPSPARFLIWWKKTPPQPDA
ncbi:hypothetical protein Pan153_62000 [Gimesia panareensis]|uniref:DUF2147 domain-containing protein n=1 Tax=Gimesia panareensis TaxID=2527978 RepID=A0A518FZ13_9PLAN|nr:hypothetical protein [Gimesia panareensis]QDV21510.1 hypothetical protein Pan153_62000 [Gimesia panareensis]